MKKVVLVALALGLSLPAMASEKSLICTNLKTVAVVPCGAKRWKKTGLKYELTS